MHLSKITNLIFYLTATLILLTACSFQKPGTEYIKGSQDWLSISDNSQYVTLCDYKHAEYSLPEAYDLTEAEYEEKMQEAIDMEIKTTFSEETRPVERIDEPAQEKDTLIITYHGTVSGQPFEGGDSPEEGEEIVLGYSSYPPEFDEGIIGMKKGETKQITVPLSSGETATYDVTVNKIEYYEIPEITDEMTKKYTKFDTADEYMADLRGNMEKNYKATVRKKTMDAILNYIVNESTYTDLPEDKINSLTEEAITIANKKAENAGMGVEEYLKTYLNTDSTDDYREMMRESAEAYLKMQIAAYEIARLEGVTVSQEDIDNYKDTLREYYHLDKNADVSAYESDEDIKFECVIDKIEPILTEHATKLAPTPMPDDVE